MLAIDHGYFQGPTTGLERIDLSIVPLLPSCDALFCTRGILRSLIPADSTKPMVLRASGGPSILREELSDEQIAMDMDDAVRLNAAGVGIQVFIGGEFETRSVHNMTKLVDAGLRAGIPVMGITAVGKNMVRDAKYFRLACRIIAELGAQYVKTYYVDEGFETVTASCPVPIVMAGGKKLAELDALTMAYNAVQQGAAGVDMGRNIFQSEAPKAMIAAINAVVHKNLKPKEAYELFSSLKVAHPAVEGLDVAVLHRPARCDIMPIDAMILCPAQHRVRGELGAIVGNDHLRLTARADEHCQLACNPFARDRGVGDCCQTFACDVIDNVEDAEAPALGELVMDKVERPARVDLGFDQDRRACSDRLPPSLAPANGQPFLAVEPIDAIDT
jgi:putative autoinducer-2 (AI-2) aldolase